MIKFDGFKFKNLSKQSMKIYGVFCRVPPNELEEYQKHFKANVNKTSNENNNYDNFMSSNYLLTTVLNENEFNNYILYYYAQKNIDHFKSWCVCHDYDGDIKNPLAVAEYYNQTISEETGDFLQGLSICSWDFAASDISYILRCYYKCVPVGSPDEFQGERENYFNDLEIQIKDTIRDTMEKMSVEEISSFLSDDLKNKIKMIEKNNNTTQQSRADNNFDEEDDRR